MLKRAIVITALVFTLAVASGHAATPPADPVPTPMQQSATQAERGPVCRIGKPSYCLKYGGSTHCEKKTTLADKPAACAAWVAGCFDCHRAISECTGGRRIDRGELMCATCTDTFSKCLRANDAKFWPTRMQVGD